MRKFLIPLAAIAASTVALAAPASASPRWGSYGYVQGAPMQPMYSSGYGVPAQPVYGYGYNRGPRMERFEHGMGRRMTMRSNRGFGWGGHERGRW